MNKKNPLFIFIISLLMALSGCSSPKTILPEPYTPTTIPPTAIVLPSETPIPPTATETTVPALPTPTEIPVNTIQHFSVGQEFTVTSINMIDANTGWATGGLMNVGDHVLKTSDGGSTWVDLTPPEEAAMPGDFKPATGFFMDGQTAWVVFSNQSGITPPQSVIWRTQDGGASWQSSQPLDITDLSEFYNPGSLQFIDGLNGWMMVHVGVGMNHDYLVLYRSKDGGHTWERLTDPYNDTSGIMGCYKTSMLFTDATHGWLTGDCHGVAPGVLLFRTSDGGSTWERVSLPDPKDSPGLFSNPDMLAACGSYTPFFFGNDSGHLGVTCAYYDSNPITYRYYIFTTIDGGNTWTSSSHPGEVLYFISRETGWAFAKKIQQTTDGGITWKAISNVTWSVLSDVTWSARADFINDQTGWAIPQAGEEMALVRTTNGGKSWAMLVPKVGQ